MLDAFCFNVITLTTVSFGDFTPSTALGKLKLFTGLYISVGVAIIVTFIYTMWKISLRRQGVERSRD